MGTTHYDSPEVILGKSKDNHNEVFMTSLQGAMKWSHEGNR